MTNEELKSQIDTLHQQMEQSKLSVNEKDFVGHLMTEIVKRSEEDIQDEEVTTLKQKLEQQSVKFEASHPTVAHSIRQLLNALGNMGI